MCVCNIFKTKAWHAHRAGFFVRCVLRPDDDEMCERAGIRKLNKGHGALRATRMDNDMECVAISQKERNRHVVRPEFGVRAASPNDFGQKVTPTK